MELKLECDTMMSFDAAVVLLLGIASSRMVCCDIAMQWQPLMDQCRSSPELRLIVPDKSLLNGKMLFNQSDVNRSNTSRIGSHSKPK
jgi:hypothetical protein